MSGIPSTEQAMAAREARISRIKADWHQHLHERSIEDEMAERIVDLEERVEALEKRGLLGNLFGGNHGKGNSNQHG